MSTFRRARYGRIERMVDELLDADGIGDAPPVPVEAMIHRRGISLQKGDLEDVSGLLVRDGSSSIIGVNGSHPAVRQRFTIAHEFGHFLLHEGIVEHVDHGYRVNYRNDESSLARDVEEIEANFFAASLLMPKRMLDACGGVDAIDDDQRVKQLATRFNVSAHAMSLRLANVYRRFAPY